MKTSLFLFGGSGLLSHAVKCVYPKSTVIYNDYDDYHIRLDNIGNTNKVLRDIRRLTESCDADKKIANDIKESILKRIKQEKGFVDYITLSSSLLFSGKYANNFKELEKQTFYNTVRKNDYEIDNNYLEGIEIVKKDYADLFFEYRYIPGVVFLVDPPYLSTDVKSYSNYWKLKDYLDVLTILKGTSYFYFTSNKSSIIELCDWLEVNLNSENPFNGATRKEVLNKINYHAGYVDIMLYKNLNSD